LKYRIAALSRYREMMIDGIVAIAEGENPRVIEYRLSAFARSDEGGAL
jgi:chemotaxis protein MotA